MPRVNIFGASGSGTTTLGRAVAARLALTTDDTHDDIWAPSDTPYVRQSAPAERERRLHEDCPPGGDWVLSGSILKWDLAVWPAFTHLVYLWVPPAVRMERLKARERARFGDMINPGGPMFDEHEGFIAWAAAYDTAGPEQRSRALHDQWLAAQAPTTLILRIEGDTTVNDRVARVLGFLAGPTA
jgi:adenylate kinase family enzyme